jgi:glycosyltransferase involved in cell wall biosynthesis
LNVAVVIPAYNEAARVADVVVAASRLGRVVVVDDASGDDTGTVAERAGASVVRHVENRGYDGALASGIATALLLDVDAVLTMDADGQHDAAVGERLLDLLDADAADVVIGRRQRKARWSEHVFAAYTWLRFRLPDPLCGMKAYRSELVRGHDDVLARTTIGAGLAVALLAQGARLGTVDVPVAPRADGSRFGRGLDANLRIVRGLGNAIAVDFAASRRRTS